MTTPEQKELRVRRKKWLACLQSKDVNSLHNQIIWMIWDAAVFRIINETRKIATKDGARPKLNSAVHELINRCFFSTQVITIRRMLDAYPIAGNRAVYSLAALIVDIRKYSALLTRKNIFKVEQLPYRIERIEAKAYRYIDERRAAGETGVWLPSKLSTAWPRSRHEHIDVLSGANPTSRLPSDCIRIIVLDALKSKLESEAKNVINYANKFVAHAATPDDRATLKAKDLRLALGHLWKAHQTIAKIANFIGVYILGEPSNSFFANPQYDILEYIDHPWIESKDLELLSKTWLGFRDEVEDWDWSIESVRKELKF